MISAQDLVDKLLKKSDQILENLDHESIRIYEFLKEEFDSTDATKNYVFQYIFRKYYGMDQARLSKEFYSTFFRLLEGFRDESKIPMRTVLLELFKKKGSVQFSFTTKMQNLINPDLPIYDEMVRLTCEIKVPYNKDYNKRIDRLVDKYEELIVLIEELKRNKLMQPMLMKFNDKFSEFQISQTKKIDFILWSAGKIIQSEKTVSI